LNKVPRELRPDQKQALRILARHVVSQLELRRRSHQLVDATKAAEGIQKELNQVREELAAARKRFREAKRKTPRLVWPRKRSRGQ